MYHIRAHTHTRRHNIPMHGYFKLSTGFDVRVCQRVAINDIHIIDDNWRNYVNCVIDIVNLLIFPFGFACGVVDDALL